MHNNMIVGDFCFKKHHIVRIFICVSTMAPIFYNKTNVKGAIKRSVIPAMVQSKVKVHKILLSQPRDI